MRRQGPTVDPRIDRIDAADRTRLLAGEGNGAARSLTLDAHIRTNVAANARQFSIVRDDGLVMFVAVDGGQ
jgi:hypothetical protein